MQLIQSDKREQRTLLSWTVEKICFLRRKSLNDVIKWELRRGGVGKKPPKKDMDNPSFLWRNMLIILETFFVFPNRTDVLYTSLFMHKYDNTKFNIYIIRMAYIMIDSLYIILGKKYKWRKSIKKSAMWRHKNEWLFISILRIFFSTFLISLIFITSHGWFLRHFVKLRRFY